MFFTGKKNVEKFLLNILISRRITVTPQNVSFKTRQAIVTFIDAKHAQKFHADIPGRDVASAFLPFNKDKVIKLFVTPARKPNYSALPFLPNKPVKPTL